MTARRVGGPSGRTLFRNDKKAITLIPVIETRFEWDERKNLSNQRKHGISFEEAAQAFRDPLYVSVHDRVVDGEVRWQTFGVVGGVLLLMVAHTVQYRSPNHEVIRIVSARPATPKERRRYEDEDR